MKALVLEKRGDTAAVLREDGTYSMTMQPCSVGETVELNAEIVSLPTYRKRWVRTVVAAALALALLTGSYSFLADSAYAYVSLDAGETSVEVSVNRLGRVISARALNEGSEEIAQALTPELRGRRLEDALPEAMERIRPENTEDALIAGVSSGSEKCREELAEAVEQAAGRLDGEKPIVYTFDVPPTERREAEDQGMSGGRYAFEQRGPAPEEETQRVETEIPAERSKAPAPENWPEQSADAGQPLPPEQTGKAPEGGQPTGTVEAPPMPEQGSTETPDESPQGTPETPQEAPPVQGEQKPGGEQPPTEHPQELPGEEVPPMPETGGGEAPVAPPQGRPDTPQETPPAQGDPMRDGALPPSEAPAGPADREAPPPSGGSGSPAPTDMEHGGAGQLPPQGRQ